MGMQNGEKHLTSNQQPLPLCNSIDEKRLDMVLTPKISVKKQQLSH